MVPMRRRYCINIDQCIVVSMALPLAWVVLLLFIFFLTMFVALAKGESDAFFALLLSPANLWLYLSGPISLAAGAAVGATFVLFPVSYVEVGDKSVRVHRAFNGDRNVRYEEMFYVRFNGSRRRWAAGIFLSYFGAEHNTIEIRKGYPRRSLWLSSSRHTYDAISAKLRSACAGKRELVEGDRFLADSQWVSEHGDPQSNKWDGHYGRY